MSKRQQVKRPPIRLLMTESYRAFIVERARYRRFMRRHKFHEQGDGHPVLVIPGLIASDVSTRPLRQFLKKSGYYAYGWGRGNNLAQMEDFHFLGERLEELYLKHEQKVSLIGWSLGGIFARQLAKEKPQLVRQLITLACPFAGPEQPNNAKWFYDLISTIRRDKALDREWIADIPNPAPVPTTAFYSKEDGIVPWELCREQIEDEIHQNIEVNTPHTGMGVNPKVLQIIVDRLQYDASHWVKWEGNY